jgi:serine/threonine-protein phosphatase Stp1
VTRIEPSTDAPLTFRSAARTDVGAVRELNEDRFVDRPDTRLWAVADGMGGHADGDIASNMVADALAALGGFSNGYSFLQAVNAALQDVNADLRARSSVSGATVVALLIEDNHAACVWAGDSRAYHLSAGVMSQLTRDHSLAQEMLDAGVAGSAPTNVVTRAVGAAEALAPETVYAPIRAGDRCLLCSDGLTAVLTDAEIAVLLSQGDIDSAADALMRAALTRRPRDNVTLVAIEAATA